MSFSTVLSADEQSRYLRHLLLSEVGKEGQLKIKNASILCVGSGGLGSPALYYLAAAGVGRIGIVDYDVVEISNLQRQILFATGDIGKSKAELAKDRILALNPEIQVEIFSERFEAHNAERILSGFDAIMDGTDNFSSRFLINDVAVKLGKPNFFGSVFKFTGQVSVFDGQSGCYRCLFPTPPSEELAPDCSQAGVLGVLPGMIGIYQAVEFLKWKLGVGSTLHGKIMTVDLLQNQFRTLSYAKNPHCIACANPSGIKLGSPEFACSSPNAVSTQANEMTVQQLSAKLGARGDLVLIDVREPTEHEIGNLGGSNIPLNQVSSRAQSLPDERDRLIVVYCRSGERSRKACEVIRRLGYTQVFNLRGGILAWQREVDPSMRT